MQASRTSSQRAVDESTAYDHFFGLGIPVSLPRQTQSRREDDRDNPTPAFFPDLQLVSAPPLIPDGDVNTVLGNP